MKGAAWLGLAAVSVAITLFFEWHTDEVTVVLAVMSLLAVIVGAMRPRWSLAGGVTIGFSIAVAHAVTENAGMMRPHYLHSTPRVGDWIAMLLAGAFVTGVAWIGGHSRSLMEREGMHSGGRQ